MPCTPSPRTATQTKQRILLHQTHLSFFSGCVSEWFWAFLCPQGLEERVLECVRFGIFLGTCLWRQGLEGRVFGSGTSPWTEPLALPRYCFTAVSVWQEAASGTVERNQQGLGQEVSCAPVKVPSEELGILCSPLCTHAQSFLPQTGALGAQPLAIDAVNQLKELLRCTFRSLTKRAFCVSMCRNTVAILSVVTCFFFF